MKNFYERLCLLICLVFGGSMMLTSCFEQVTPEQQQEIDEIATSLVGYKKYLDELETKFQNGEIGVQVYNDAKTRTQTLIMDLTERANRLKDSGVSTLGIVYQTLASIVGTFFLRGTPSKGPLSFIRRLTGGSVRDRRDE